MGNAKKILKTRITEFFSLWKYYSFLYALYNAVWWFCFYTRPPFCYKLSTYAIKKKTAWLDKYIEREYKHIIDKYKKAGITDAGTIIKEPTIWIFWGQGEENMPPLVKACYKQLTRNNCNVTLVTSKNINEFLDLPQEVIDKVNCGKISWAYFSDIIRNSLLTKYGGLWMDATVWAPHKLPIKEFMNYRFFSPGTRIVVNNRTINFWSNFEWSWNGWCLWSNMTNYPIFSFVADMLTEIAIKEEVIPDYVTIDYLIYYAIRSHPTTHKDLEFSQTFNCKNRHTLASIMHEEYNEVQYKELIEDNFFFKLSFRAGWKERTKEGKKTFYGHLISNPQ